ncbi:MAG: tetratricopeptide repeat protein, partial [Myxococcales bacterium]|nr:tetratricopeptide repeat protein [Myxococcales bacterium]
MGKSLGLRVVIVALAALVALGCATRYRIETLEPTSDAFHKERIRLLGELQKSPTNASVLYQLGLGFARMNQHRVALNYFDRAHQASPKNAEILMHRGLTAQHLGLRMSAWQDFQRVLELDPTKRQALVKPYAKLLRSVAERFRRYRQFERAIQVIDQLRLLQGKLDASDRLILAEVHFQRARRQIRPHSTDKKALEKAMADLKRADALGLKSAELQLWLGIALLARGSKREAHKHFDRFTGVPSENVARVERLLTLLRDYGHSAEGIERLQDYLKRHPHAPPRFHRQLGDLLLAAGKNREALSAYESWLKRSGKSSRARLALRLASTMIQKRMYTQAASLFHKAIELEPDDAAPFRLLLIYARQRSSDGSSVRMQAMLDELITKHPRPGWVRSAVGELYREVGDSKRALEYFEQALKATPPYWRALLGIARLQQLAGDRSRRDQAINRWLASQNKNARSYRDAGDLLMELQERDDAMKLYRAGMRSKGDLESMLLRAYVYRLEGEFSKETTEVDGFLRNLTKNSRSSALLAIGRFYLELHDNRPALRYLGQLVSAERDANARQGHLLLGDLYSVQPLRNLSRAAVHYRGYLALTTSDKRKALEKLCAHLDDRSGLQSLQAELFEQLAQYHPNKKAFYLQIGRRFLDRRDGTQALRFMRQYLKLSGGSADERIRVASLFADAKLTSQALQLIRDLPSKLLLKKVSAPGLHRELGDYLRRQGRVADAEAHYRRYLAQNEPDSNEMFRFGNTLSSSQFCDLAVYAYRLSGADTKGLQKGIVEPTKDERLSKKSHYTSSLHRMFMNLGRCYVAIAQPDRAEKAFDAALASRYRSYYYFSSIGGIFFRANYLKKAIKYYEQLYKQKYGSSRYVYRTILDIYIRTGMTDRIPKLVSAYIERHSRSRYYRPHRDIAKLLAEFGLFERAIAILEKARLKKPKDAEYAFYLGQFYLQDGQTAKGMAILRNLTDVSSWGSHAGLRYAEMGLRVLMRRGMFRDALLIADKVLKANPSEARWLLLRGTLYARLGDAVKAKRDIGDALTTQLSLGRSLSSVVGEFRTLRRLDLAIELLNHLRLLNPKRATHLRDLAQLYAENGQIDDAKQSYLEYARLDKNGLLAAARFFRRIGELDRARRLLLKTFDVPRFTQLQQVLIELHDIYSTLGRRNELDSVVNQLVLSQRDKQQAYKLVVAYYQRFYDAEKLRRAQEQLRKYTTHDARLFRAQVLLSEGKFESAMPLLRSLILRRESHSPRRYGFYSRYTRYRYWRRRVYFTLGLSGPQQVVSLVASYGRLDLARELARLAV